MKYLDWNNLLGAKIFNEHQQGCDVLVHLTKQGIIKVGSTHLAGHSEGEIWNDFAGAMRRGLPGSPQGEQVFLEKINYAYAKQACVKIDGTGVNFPTYLSYLLLTVLPLSGENNAFHATDYYQRAREFFKSNRFPQLEQNDLSTIRPIWEALERWSCDTKAGSLGTFRVRNFTKWSHVGIPLSQCLISPYGFRQLPELFWSEGISPNRFLPDSALVDLLKRNGNKLRIRPHFLDSLEKSGDELGAVLLGLVRQTYNRWTGEVSLKSSSDLPGMQNDGWTDVPLSLSFHDDRPNETLTFSYRIQSVRELPEDLLLGGERVEEWGSGWSKALRLPKENEGRLEKRYKIEDPVQQWRAESKPRPVRAFVNAAQFNLSSTHWLETETVGPVANYRLLCSVSKRDELLAWGKQYAASCDEVHGYDGIPAGYVVLVVKQPRSAPPGLSWQAGGFCPIELRGGLKLAPGKYLDGYLPTIFQLAPTGFVGLTGRRTNGEDEEVTLNSDGQEGRYVLPPSSDFSSIEIWIENNGTRSVWERFEVRQLTGKADWLDTEAIPARDALGQVIEPPPVGQHVRGNSIPGLNFAHQYNTNIIFFNGTCPDKSEIVSTHAYDSEPDTLLGYLTARGVLSSDVFKQAFELLWQRKEPNADTENLTGLKRASLNLYDTLGHVDYDYKRGKIVVLPPQLILIPSARGIRALLLGGRTPELVNCLLELAPRHGLGATIEPAEQGKNPHFLPQRIVVHGSHQNQLQPFAMEAGLLFSTDLLQWGLMEFSQGLKTYIEILPSRLDPESENGVQMQRYFDPQTLRFERCEEGNFKWNLALTEYSRYGQARYWFWENGQCYPVDKSWGRFLLRKKWEESLSEWEAAALRLVFHDPERWLVAVPARLPLPRLLARSLVLLSGLAPAYRKLTLAGMKNEVFNVYANVPNTFVRNFFDKVGQSVQTTSILL